MIVTLQCQNTVCKLHAHLNAGQSPISASNASQSWTIHKQIAHKQGPCMRLMALLQTVLSKQVKHRLLSGWHDVYIHAVMKRFQMARAQGLHREHVELRAVHLWQAHCRKQQRKAAMQAKAHGFARQEDFDGPMHVVLLHVERQCWGCCKLVQDVAVLCLVGCSVCLLGWLSVARLTD